MLHKKIFWPGIIRYTLLSDRIVKMEVGVEIFL